MYRIATWYRERVRRLVKNRSGVVAMEFVLVAPVFFFLVFAILETSLLFFTAAVMNGEVSAAARSIRTGNLQLEEEPEDALYEQLCSNLDNVLDCDEVIVDIRTYESFDDMTFDEFLNDEGEADGNLFDIGEAGEVVLVRIAYKYQIITPFLAEFLAPPNQDTLMLQVAAAFQSLF